MAYILMATENCAECRRVKKFISGNNLNILTGEPDEKMIAIFRRAGIRTFPVLIDDNGSDGFVIMAKGSEAGGYIAENIKKFR